jgi:hypothetical protein
MNEKLKQKLAYWSENFLYLGGILFGFSILIGGVYMLYHVIKSLFS